MDENELQKMYFYLVKSSYEEKKLSRTCYENLIDRFAYDLEELEQNSKDLCHALEHAEYYITLESLEQGLDFIKSIDPSHKLWDAANAKCDRLRIALERLTPKEESA